MWVTWEVSSSSNEMVRDMPTKHIQTCSGKEEPGHRQDVPGQGGSRDRKDYSQGKPEETRHGICEALRRRAPSGPGPGRDEYPRDLDEAFFGRGDNILGAAMSQVIDPSSFDDIHYIVDGSIIQEKLSLKGKLSPAVMSDLSKEVGGSLYSMDKFFGMRVAATMTESYAIDLTSISSYSQMGGWTEWGKNRDDEELKQINVAMVTDASGIPTMFKMLPGSVADMATLKDLVDDMERLGCKGSRLIMDRGFESASNVHGMLELGVPFVMPSNERSEPIKKLITRAIKDMRDSSSLSSHDGDTYKFIEYQAAVAECMDDDGYEYLVRLPQSEKGSAENNRRFDEAKKLKASSCTIRKRRPRTSSSLVRPSQRLKASSMAVSSGPRRSSSISSCRR